MKKVCHRAYLGILHTKGADVDRCIGPWKPSPAFLAFPSTRRRHRKPPLRGGSMRCRAAAAPPLQPRRRAHRVCFVSCDGAACSASWMRVGRLQSCWQACRSAGSAAEAADHEDGSECTAQHRDMSSRCDVDFDQLWSRKLRILTFSVLKFSSPAARSKGLRRLLPQIGYPGRQASACRSSRWGRYPGGAAARGD